MRKRQSHPTRFGNFRPLMRIENLEFDSVLKHLCSWSVLSKSLISFSMTFLIIDVQTHRYYLYAGAEPVVLPLFLVNLGLAEPCGYWAADDISNLFRINTRIREINSNFKQIAIYLRKPLLRYPSWLSENRPP